MIKNGLDNPRLRAETFKARFLEAAVVEYNDERVLIKPENLMKMALKFKGAKVIIDHKDVTAENANEIVGYINNIWIGDDGWAWCDFTVNDAEAINLINRGYSVSCCYVAVTSGNGGTKNAVPYNREVVDIEENDEVTHLAIVENPRYEDAIILKNSIKNKMKNIFKFTSKKETKENSVKELDLENSFIQLSNGSDLPMAEAIKICENEAKKEEEKENEYHEDKPKINDDTEIEVGGKMMKVSEMKKIVESAKKNEEDEAKKNAEEEEEKKKEKENAEKEEAEEKKKEAKKNSIDAKKIAEDIKKFENGKKIESSKVITDRARFELGRLAYGEPQKVTK